MKRTVVALSLMGLMVLPAFGQDKEADRVKAAGTVISEIMNVPDDIPQSVIDKADCVVVLPSVLKAAFIVGGSYGRGVLTCRSGQTLSRSLECSQHDGSGRRERRISIGWPGYRFRPPAHEPDFGCKHPQEQGQDRWRRLRGGRPGWPQCFR